jgi:excisionase family DNA binding protein
MAGSPCLAASVSGAVVSPLAAAVFFEMLDKPLRRRVSLASGIDPRNRDELLSNLEELARVGREWVASQPSISVVSRLSTEMASVSVADMEISPKNAGELLRLTDARIRQLLRDGSLPGRKVGRRWVVKRSAVIAYRAPRKAVA